eukprot:6190107-Amphidinium_carterae.2
MLQPFLLQGQADLVGGWSGGATVIRCVRETDMPNGSTETAVQHGNPDSGNLASRNETRQHSHRKAI